MSAATPAIKTSDETTSAPIADVSLPKTDSPNENSRSFTVQIVDAAGLLEPGGALPDFGGRVAWRLSVDAHTPAEAPPDFVITLTRDTAELADRRPQRVGVSVVVDSPIPIGLRDCGALLACERGEVRDTVATLAHAIFRVALADQVVRYDWMEIEELLRGDCLLIVRALPASSTDAFASAAIGAIAYFQGRTRIEPDSLLLGIAAPEILPLTQRRELTRPLLALAGHHCAFLAGVHTRRGHSPEAALLLTYPIPRMPGEVVRPKLRRQQ